MPIYEYIAVSNGCALCVARFERLQKMTDSALNMCPQCGAPVQRVISAAQVVSGQSQRLKEEHIGKHGFTQYKRAGQGVYEKTVGSGPDYISSDSNMPPAPDTHRSKF